MTNPIQLVGGVAHVQAGSEGADSFPVVASSLIYSSQAYSAFPRALKLADGSGYLIALKGGASHEGAGDGRILFSADFSTWSVRATIAPESPTNTVQELVLCQHADGRVQLITRHFTLGSQASRNRVQYSSDNGATWTATEAITGPTGNAYMTARVGDDIFLSTYNATNAANLYRFTADTAAEFVANVGGATANCEAAFCATASGEIVAHIRHEPNGAASTIVSAVAPYTSWTTRGTWNPWHGQVIRRAPDGTLWGLGRWFHSPASVAGASITAVVRYDGHTPRVVAYLPPLSPSAWGDCGYGDLVWVGSESYPRAVYYAPGGTTTAIYIATISGAT